MLTWIIISLSVFIAGYNFLARRKLEEKIKENTQQIKETDSQLIQMEKMASVGVLSAGIAHEINNPLSFIIGNLDYFKSYIAKLDIAKNEADAENLKQVLEEVYEGALRIKRIVRDLRTFSSKSENVQSKLDVHQILDSALTIIWNEIKYKLSVIKEYNAKGLCLADSTQLSQVFLNLLLNASQAIKDKGTIKISTYEDAKNIYISIQDTGCGIPEDILSKIFEPFFSTKKSVGLGLSVSYNIIKKQGGDIKVKSKVGEGTTFSVELLKAKEDEGGERDEKSV